MAGGEIYLGPVDFTIQNSVWPRGGQANICERYAENLFRALLGTHPTFFFQSFSYKKYGTRANLYYGTKIYFGRRFQRGRGKFLTKRIRGHTLFGMVKSTGPR